MGEADEEVYDPGDLVDGLDPWRPGPELSTGGKVAFGLVLGIIGGLWLLWKVIQLFAIMAM